MKSPGTLFTLGCLISTLSVQALTINVTYDASITNLANAAQVEAAFNNAAQMFQGAYTNAITVNIGVYWGSTGPFSGGIGLGASSTALVGNPSYATLTNALRAARTSLADTNSCASLPAVDPAAGTVWWIPRAEAKVLGLLGVPKNDSVNDGDIGFASNLTYTFDATNRAVSGKYDFIGVALHELTEVMGHIYSLNVGGGGFVPFDLFRFTNSNAHSYNTAATNAYFSVNNGTNVLKYFYTNINLGDIQDWQSSTPPDACDAFVSTGKQLFFSTNDTIVLDVLGYNLAPVSAPRLTGNKLSGASFQLGFTNVPNLTFTVLATTNLTQALTNWANAGVVTQITYGQYQFAEAQGTNKQRFYRVSSP
jgi:hypothetical protein